MILFICILPLVAYVQRDLLAKELTHTLELICGYVMKSPALMNLLGYVMATMGTVVKTKGKSKLFLFSVGTERHFIPLPFDRKKSKVSVKLTYEDDKSETFCYPKGVPFYCSPAQLGCESITIIRDGDEDLVFTGDDVPAI